MFLTRGKAQRGKQWYTPTGLIASELGRTEDAIRDKVGSEGLPLAPTNRSPRD
jgi:hypothetical protein